MTDDWYAPNQQAVRPDGSGPAEEGHGGPQPKQKKAKPDDRSAKVEEKPPAKGEEKREEKAEEKPRGKEASGVRLR